MTEGTSQGANSGFQAASTEHLDRDASTRVVVAVADAKDTDPVAMETRLHDWVDPDALDAAVRSMDAGFVEFDMASYRVRVRADGRVSVERTE